MMYPLTLGGVSFDENPFEGPNGFAEGLSDLGSTQKAVVREYPGGIMTAQLLGSFPKPISWQGILYGAYAMGRSADLQQLCDSGQQVVLSWAQWSFTGFVEDFQCDIKAPHEIHFKIVFRPLQNNNAGAGGGQLANTDPFASTISNAQTVMKQQTAAPASGYVFSGGITDSVNALSRSVNSALQNSGGSVSNMDPSDAQGIQSQVTSIQSQLQPLINGPDPVAASAAADLNGSISTIGTSVNNSLGSNYKTVELFSPNVYSLAAQYYGDPTQYQPILDASGITDPLPSGLVKITIPVLGRQPASPVTIMSDAA